jgi:vitamin B12 transporter
MIRLLALAAVVPLSLVAQTRPDSAPQALPAVSVTATRSELAARAQPFTVTVFDRAALRDAGITQVADVVRLVPGATVLRGGSYGALTSVFLRGGESDYVQVLVDGVPQNAPGGAYDFGQLTLDNVERVEVVRGPASVLYGSDAVSGVIQIFTRTGARRTQLTGLVGGGTYGTWDYALGAVGGSSRLGWSLDAARHLTDGIYPFNSAFRNDVLSGGARWRGRKADLGASARVTDYTFHYPTDFAGALSDSNAVSSEERAIVSADGGWKVGTHFELRGRVVNNRADPRTRDLPDSAGDQDLFTSDGTVTRRIVGGEAIVKLGATHVFTFAVEHARDRETSSFHSESAFGPFDGATDVTRDNRGYALQLLGNVGRIGKGGTYTLGMRQDDNSKFGKFTTYRAAGSLHLSATTTVRASFGTAYKAPTFFENFATGSAVGNSALTPERTRTAEAGLQFVAPGNNLTLGATAFRQRFRDLIQYVANVPANAPNFANLAGASADGVELEAGWRIAAGTVVRGSYTRLHTEVTDAGIDEGPSASFVKGARLLRRPTHLATLGIRESVAGQGSFDISLTYTGARDDRDFSAFPATPVVLKAYTRVDVALTKPLDSFGPLRNPSLIVRVENQFNKSYQQVLGFRSPGRMYFVGMRIGD